MKSRGKLFSIVLAPIILFLMMASIVDAAPFAYIPNSGDKTISVIDTANDTIVDTVNIGFGAEAIAVDSKGARVYLVEHGTSNNDTIDVFDTNINNITYKIPTGYKIYGVAVTPDGTKVYATSPFSNTVSVINTSTNNVATTIMDVGNRPSGVAVSPDGKKLYVTNTPFNDNSSVSVIDTSTNNVTNTIMVGESSAVFITVNPADEKQIYVANVGMDSRLTATNVYTIDTANNNVTAKVKVENSVRGLDVSPDGTKVYAATTNLSRFPPPYLGTVDVINTATNNVTATVPVGDFPIGIAVTPDGSKVYVPNSRSGENVSVIDAETNTVIDSVPVGKTPGAFGRFIGYAPYTFTITPSKIRISDNVQYDARQSVALDLSKDSIFWDFGDGTTDASGNPVVNHSYSKLGSYKATLTVKDSKGNVYTTSRFVHVTIPVVLVHGWRSSPVVWNNMTNRLQQEGFEVWNFDYEQFNTFNPQDIAPLLSNFTDTQRNDLTYNGQKYNGPIDIVCHSMGALVSRYYLEDLNGGIHGKDVRQWIGIAPAHHGAAAADLAPSISVFSSRPLLKLLYLNFLGEAVEELKTTSDTVQSLGPLSPTTKYRVIAGWNPTHSNDFGGGVISVTLAKRISGSGPLYYWTYSGDMIVATAQSYDPAMEFDAFPIGGILGNSPAYEFDHINIHSSPKVIETVIGYLKDINKTSSNICPPDDEISLENLNFIQIVISGYLNSNSIQQINVPTGSNAGSKPQLNSNNLTKLQGTASSPENTLVTFLDWDDGDINMTLTSPSGIEYSANSHPNDTWYMKDGNSLNYIITDPESGNWTVNLIPANYPGHDIHYNLTYVVRNINVSEPGVLPVANFTSNVTEGFVPLSVTFTNMSTYATSLYWDFGDGYNSTSSTPTHIYSTVGNYIVNLTAINGNGTDSKTATINVLKATPTITRSSPADITTEHH